MAERVGFEPTIPLQVCRISSAVHSTTLPPLRMRERLRCALLININGRADKRNFAFVSQIIRHREGWRNASAFGGFHRHFKMTRIGLQPCASHSVTVLKQLIAPQDFHNLVILLLIGQQGRLTAGADAGVLQVE